LQNVALLHNRLFMDVGALPQHYLHAIGTVMKAEGVDDLSRAVARSPIYASKSTRALRDIMAAEAERWLGVPLLLDLQAFRCRRECWLQCPGPAVLRAVPGASRGGCRRAGSTSLGPLSLPSLWITASGERFHVSASVAAAGFRREGEGGLDGLRDIVVAPCTPSDPVWQALASASLTVISGQKDRCLIFPNPAKFVHDGEELGGA
jgi:hypothetical protein